MFVESKSKFFTKKKLLSVVGFSAVFYCLTACESTQVSESMHTKFEIDHSHLPNALIAEPLEVVKEGDISDANGAPFVNIIIEDDLHFEPDSFYLNNQSKKLLTKLASDLAPDSGLDVLLVELNGFTSAEGDDARNTSLAQRRINSVKIYLSNLVDRELHWKTRAFNGSQTLALSEGHAHGDKNSRVELLVRAKFKLKNL